MTNASRLAVLNAMSLLGSKDKQGVNQPARQANIPTAKTRNALELLFRSTVDDLRDNQVNMREVASDLFNWSGTANKATKTVARALTAALNTPGKYAHAVELTSFVAAMAPLLEPDRLARLFGAVNETEAVYAPNMYTLQLSQQISQVFTRYPEQTREKLAYTLWVAAHDGRWWDMTTGVTVINEGEVEQVQDTRSNKELVRDYIKSSVTWTPDIAERFKALPYNEDVLGFIRKYNALYLRGKVLDPDVALLSAYVPWIPLEDRTESPVGILLRELMNIVDTVEDFTLPDRPRTFKNLFPDIRLVVGNGFPFPQEVMATNGHTLTPGCTMEVVSTPAALMDNKDYMGNCTWSYKGRMEEGKYVLYRIHDKGKGEIYNASMIISMSGDRVTWRVGEINSRYNRANVPTVVRDAFSEFTKQVPTPSKNYLDAIMDSKSQKARKMRYKLFSG